MTGSLAANSPPAGTQRVGIIGAGTMGAGIAQVAAAHGWTARLLDVDEDVARAAVTAIAARFDRLVEKGRMTNAERDAAAARVRVAESVADLAGCGIVIEAVVEDLDVKTRVLTAVLRVVAPDAIIATNTSSLSVTAIGAAIDAEARTVGMHFFNPAPLLRLVEIVPGRDTDPAVVDRAAEIATGWGKTVARAADVPGFIVNHVARPYYLEAFRILEDGLAPVDAIDAAMKRLGGFRMGPLELTDLIGQDVNAATSRSVWEQLGRPALLAPSRLQESLVAEGHLGRKTGRGLYLYPEGGAAGVANPAIAPGAAGPPESAALDGAVDDFVARATDERGEGPERLVFARILVAIIAQAFLAHERGVAEKADIDTALLHGVNYPRGPFEWAEQIGVDRCARLLETLDATAADGRFAVPASMAVRT